MIRRCRERDLESLLAIINAAAVRYQGVIPPDCWKEPYMSREEIEHEIRAGVVFWGLERQGRLLGAMGLQDVQDVTLIRHAYVRPESQRQGIGGELLAFLLQRTQRPVLLGTWAAADWAIRFYEGRGFGRVPEEVKDRLLTKYWSVPAPQARASVVLADERWFESQAKG